MILVAYISARLLFWFCWLLFYASGCPSPWAWILLFGGIGSGLLFSGRVEPPPPIWCFVAIALCGFQVYVWTQGWPSHLTTPLFWATLIATPMTMLDEYLLRRPHRS